MNTLCVTFRGQLPTTLKKWMIADVAGLFGSGLREPKFQLRQYVVRPDNFATSHRYNLAICGTKFNKWFICRNFFHGDLHYRHAAVDRVKRSMGYVLTHRLGEGLAAAMSWYARP